MAIDEKTLTKGQIRKLNALRKSIGDVLGEQAFAKWLKQEMATKPEVGPDPVAEMIAEAIKPLARKKDINLGRYGYLVRRARGKGAKGFVVERIEKT